MKARHPQVRSGHRGKPFMTMIVWGCSLACMPRNQTDPKTPLGSVSHVPGQECSPGIGLRPFAKVLHDGLGPGVGSNRDLALSWS